MVESLWQDLRHGARMLVKNPGFALVVTLSIAIGVGANVAMFSITDGLILRPLAVPDAGGLVTLIATTPTGEVRYSGVSYPDYVDIRSHVGSFAGLAATRGLLASLSHRDEPAQGTYGVAVSANFFDVLGVHPALGRGFIPDEDRVGSRNAVAVLAHEAWTEQFGANPDIVGQEVRLNGVPFTVIGVAPTGFTGTSIYQPPSLYVPLAVLPALETSVESNVLERRDLRTLRVIGRVAPGASLAQASQDVEIAARALEQEYPDTNARYGMLVRGEMSARVAEYTAMAGLGLILVGLAGAVLLVACANVAGLLTSRAPARAREIAVRLAIGGSRGRLTRQLITETALLAAAGSVAGLALASLMIQTFARFQVVSDFGVRLTYALDQRALIIALVVAVVSALLSSAIPAWRTARAGDLAQTLRNASAPAGRVARLWGRHGLVAAQIALTLVLLTVALSFYRAFQSEYGRGPGFRTDHLLLASVDTGLARYDSRQSDTFFRELKDRVAALPRVTSVSLTSFLPLSQDGGAVNIVPEGFDLPAGAESLAVAAARVDGAYFDALGIPVLQGRGFLTTDTRGTPRVAVVSRGMAERYWPGQDPLGKRIRLMEADGAWAEVVGMAADIKFRLFTQASTPFLYLPRLQTPATRMTLVVATDTEPAELSAQVRAAIAATGRDVPILGMRTMAAFYYANARNLNTIVVRTIAGMGTMGLVLALIGLYGLTVYAVSRRTREFGIRMAVGALPGSVSRMVLRQSSLPSAVGIVAGVVASMAAGGLINGIFPGTRGDSVTYLSIVPAVIAVVTLAAYLPARRASRIDPLVALRQD